MHGMEVEELKEVTTRESGEGLLCQVDVERQVSSRPGYPGHDARGIWEDKGHITPRLEHWKDQNANMIMSHGVEP
eukprot:CAMPEP_0202897340 /NCGR_PEP_ID=MMETSP1392-20130828/6125_1 /ASSEMBLY_ACC=CAM_ASM_000868 /TAXON_ID=225041 /ORGANISM="Chlamydomonas chlamydogama, Strain SAG 11-48b" /LENGTH=74 /DNA_ID=CAMNT_0049582949 /DNA_START=1177 /DNA_END=1402 /DNA_ORIENTATION=+